MRSTTHLLRPSLLPRGDQKRQCSRGATHAQCYAIFLCSLLPQCDQKLVLQPRSRACAVENTWCSPWCCRLATKSPYCSLGTTHARYSTLVGPASFSTPTPPPYCFIPPSHAPRPRLPTLFGFPSSTLPPSRLGPASPPEAASPTLGPSSPLALTPPPKSP